MRQGTLHPELKRIQAGKATTRLWRREVVIGPWIAHSVVSLGQPRIMAVNRVAARRQPLRALRHVVDRIHRDGLILRRRRRLLCLVSPAVASPRGLSCSPVSRAAGPDTTHESLGSTVAG